MPFMVWNDRLSVGVEAVDDDHKVILSLINELYDAILAGNGCDRLRSILDHLANHLECHFNLEESLFGRIAYPDAQAHKQEHERFRVWMRDTRERLGNYDLPAPTLEVMTFLKDWLFDHFLHYDQGFAPYLKAAQHSPVREGA